MTVPLVSDPFNSSFNLSAGGAAYGGALGGTLSIYIDFETARPYLFLSGEGGAIPLSWFSTQRGFQWSIGAGLIFNASSPKDLSGGSSTATWPLAMMRWVVPSPLKLGSYWALMMNLAKKVKNAKWYKQISFQNQVSWSTDTVEMSFMLGSYTFAGTASWASDPIDIYDAVDDLQEDVRNVIIEIRDSIRLTRDSYDTADEVMDNIERIKNIIDGVPQMQY